MESDKPVVSDEQIKSFFQAFRNMYGISFDPECEFAKIAETYAKDNLNDGNSMIMHAGYAFDLINHSVYYPVSFLEMEKKRKLKKTFNSKGQSSK